MRFTKRTVLTSLLIGVAVLAAGSPGLAQQAPEDESKSTAPKTGSISGRVMNETGQPIPNAAVFISAPMALPQPRTTVTDDGGYFEVNGLDALLYLVNGSAPSYITAPREPDTPAPYYRIGDAVTITMFKGAVITGTVTSAIGEPMVQAGVRALLIRDAQGKTPSGPRFPFERTTDDRGVYRIYGLAGGTYLVSAGGRSSYGFSPNAYDNDAPTYAPSSTRDTAAEIVVRAGEEMSGVDIRHRGEPGHAISGIVSGPTAPNSTPNITLAQVVNGLPQASGFSYQPANSKGFAFYGVADGDYDLVAQSSLVAGETAASESRRITVKGADVSGIELVLKALASISGQVVLEISKADECKNKRRPSFAETLLVARRSEKNIPKDQLAFPTLFAQTSPDKAGDFVLRNLVSGQRDLSVRFFAKYWYLRSITRDDPAAPLPKTGAASRQKDVARNGITLKFGERVSGVKVTLAEGAASLRGAVKVSPAESVLPKLYLHLVPAEKETTEDVLRFFVTLVNADGSFVVNNLPPGRYWTLARVTADNEPRSDLKLRTSDEAAVRTRVRLAAEAVKKEIELKPCQNVIDFQVPFTSSSVKN